MWPSSSILHSHSSARPASNATALVSSPIHTSLTLFSPSSVLLCFVCILWAVSPKRLSAISEQGLTRGILQFHLSAQCKIRPSECSLSRVMSRSARKPFNISLGPSTSTLNNFLWHSTSSTHCLHLPTQLVSRYILQFSQLTASAQEQVCLLVHKYLLP